MEDEKLLILMASKLTVIVQNAVLESYLGTQSVGQFVDEGREEEDDVPHTFASKMDTCQFLSMYVYIGYALFFNRLCIKKMDIRKH